MNKVTNVHAVVEKDFPAEFPKAYFPVTIFFVVYLTTLSVAQTNSVERLDD
jgi:hypothetical protein